MGFEVELGIFPMMAFLVVPFEDLSAQEVVVIDEMELAETLPYTNK